MKNMKHTMINRSAVILLALAAAGLCPAQLARAENVTNAIAVVRETYGADRQAFVEEHMQLTDEEGKTFWPLYREYRAEREKLGDGLVNLVVEYAHVYPNVPEDRARQLLADFTALEKKLADQRVAHLKKFGKKLPASKVLRFAQLENRQDLALRLQLASAIPLTPVEGQLSGATAGGTIVAHGVPGGTVVRTHQLTATVTAVNLADRKVTLLGTDGVKQTVQIAPEAINFDQIQVGDTLRVEVTEELVVQLVSPGEPTESGGAALVALAPKGAKPGGVMAATQQIVGTVKAIDLQKRTATLQFEDGSTRTLPVRSDVDLAKRKIGEKVVFCATEMVAIRVEKR